MYAKNVAFPVLVPATLLALIAALFFFSQAASAEPRPGEEPGAGPGVRGGVVGVPVLPGEPPAQEQQAAPPAAFFLPVLPGGASGSRNNS